jgi:hypothetical protein
MTNAETNEEARKINDSVQRDNGMAAGSSAPTCWQPTSKEAQYVNLIMSMCTDCLLHRGTVDCATFTGNLRMITDQLDQIANAPDDGRGTPRTVQPDVRVRRSLWLWIKTHIEEEIEDADMQIHAEDTVASARSLLREINEVPCDDANNVYTDIQKERSEE